MCRITKALLVSLLATTALAAPSHGHYKHKHHRHSTGTGGGVPPSSAAPYGLGNSTAVGPTGTGTGVGTGSGPVVYSTVMVLPVQATGIAGAGGVAASPVGVNHAAGGSDTTTDCPGTVYVTASNTVTVTVPYGGGSSTAAAAAISTPVDSSPPSDTPSAPYGAGNATDSAVNAAGTAMSDKPYSPWTAPLVSPVETPTSQAAAAASPSTTSTTSTTPTVPVPVEAPPASSPAAVETTPANSPAPVAYTPAPAAYTPASVAMAASSTAAANAPAPVSAKVPAPAGVSATPVSNNTPPPSGVKRGLVYNTASLCAPLESSRVISWAYNWDSSSHGLSSSLDYVPMLWGLNGQQDSFVANTKAAIAAGAKYVMGFNEPDMIHQWGGSELNPGDAVTGWKTYMQQFADKVQLGSPAVTNANSTSPPKGIPWIKEFEKECAGACRIDFYNIHWYGWDNAKATDQAQAFKDYVIKAKQELGGKPLWVTEFAARPLEDQTVNKAFMDIVLPWLDGSESGVDRYSYFMVSDGSLVQGGGLTPMGKAYLVDS